MGSEQSRGTRDRAEALGRRAGRLVKGARLSPSPCSGRRRQGRGYEARSRPNPTGRRRDEGPSLMDAPTIQYARASDGVTTAFCVQGEGPLVIATPLLYHGIQNSQTLPAEKDFYDSLTEVCRFVRYDRRGTGLSERNVTDFSIEALIRDLDAVVEKLSAERFALLAGFLSGPVAITYAARHPDRGAYARGADYVHAPQVQASIALLKADWEMYTETQAQFISAWTGGARSASRGEAMLNRGTTESAPGKPLRHAPGSLPFLVHAADYPGSSR